MADIKSCGFIVFRDSPNRSFLLMEHKTRWDLPKGHVDEGESDIECALRELEEETGIQSDQIRMERGFQYQQFYRVQKDRGQPVDKTKELLIFLGWLIEDVNIEVTEHIGYRWFDWNPPHSIQQQTIDPLLAFVARHLKNGSS